MNRFTIFDVETANQNPDSICSIGIVLVEDSTIIKEYYQLIQPNTYFDRRNIQIHGITEADVENAPTFADIWHEIRGFFEHSLVLAHYAVFDIGCLRAELRRWQLTCEPFQYSCTCILGRKVLPQLPNHKLNTIAHHYQFTFMHHNAMEDARTTALIALEYLKTIPTSSMQVLHERYHAKVKHFYQDSSLRKQQAATAQNYHLLYKKRVCVGGTLALPMTELKERLYAIGAMYDAILDPATDLLVTGHLSEDSVPIQTIHALPSAYKAEIIDEALFLQLLDYPSGQQLASIPEQVPAKEPQIQVICASLLYNEDKELLLLQHANSRWSIPYAYLDPQKTLEDTLQNKLQESCGFTASLQLKTVLSGKDYWIEEANGTLQSYVITVYEAEAVSSLIASQLPSHFFSHSQLPPLDPVTALVLSRMKQTA